ncbi:hypothetical protein [Qipengyuania sp.]|uniref:hypothetical protein n=1 Tax=Qipengyuania sp. TaxID=2004515 RepID=UPI003736ADB0
MREWNRAGNCRVRVRAPRSDAETERLERQRQRQRAKLAPVTSLTRPLRGLPRYRAVIVDKAGRRGIFVDFVYDSAKDNRFGVARRRVEYMFKDGHAELVDGQIIFRSNLGESYGEIIAAVTVIETANRSARKNAKVGTNAIYQFAADLDQAGRLRAMKLLAAKYEALGLAYVMVPHVPSPGSDQRNFHVHVWSTIRPMERVGPYEWNIGQQLRTDCDGPDALYDLRRTWAEICTKVSHERGERYRYTHLGNAERGLPHRAQERLGKLQVDNWRKGKHEEAVAAMGATIAANEALVAEIDQRKAHEKDEAARTSSDDLERLAATKHGSRPAPARRIESGKEMQDVPVAATETGSSSGRSLAPTDLAKSVPGPAAGPVPAAAVSPPTGPSMPPEKEKRPQLLRAPPATPVPRLKPTPDHPHPIPLAPTPSPTAPMQLSPVGTWPTPPALSAFAGERPPRLTATPERQSAPKLGPTRVSAVVRLTPITVPRPIALKPIPPMPSPPKLSAAPKSIVPLPLKPTSNIRIVELAPVSRPGIPVLTPVIRPPNPVLTPTPKPLECPVLTATSSVTIPRLQPTASTPVPRLYPVGRPPVPFLTPTMPDPEREQRDDFTKRLLFGRLSLGLAIQGAQLSMTGERLAHGRAATGEEEALLDRASLEVFAVNRAVALRAKATIGRLVALYIEREDRSDPHTPAIASFASGNRSIGILPHAQEAVAEAHPSEVQPGKAMRAPPPTGASDTSASGGGLGISPSRSSDVEQSGEDLVDETDWRRSGRAVDPLERIQWWFADMRRQQRKRLVRFRGSMLALPQDVLAQLELTVNEFATPEMQNALRAEHIQQIDDIGRIVEHFAAKPGDLYAVTGGRRAHQDVPRDIREEVDRWLMEPIVQSALCELSAMHDVVADSPQYQRRIDLLHDIIYPRARVQARPLDDTQTGPRGAAVSPVETDTGVAIKNDHESPADETAPRPVGWPFPGSDSGRGGA